MSFGGLLYRQIPHHSITSSPLTARVGLRGAFSPLRHARRSNVHTFADARVSSRLQVAQRRISPSWGRVAAVTAVGLGATTLSLPVVFCDSPTKATPTPAGPTGATPGSSAPPPPPESVLNVYELSFGTVCGVCAGVFIKKGAKMVAFFLGGVFVLLQYLGQQSIIRVDWARMGSRFENLFYSTDKVTGAKRAPTVSSLWTWLVDFLTADFQPRATFIAGLLLGLRIG